MSSSSRTGAGNRLSPSWKPIIAMPVSDYRQADIQSSPNKKPIIAMPVMFISQPIADHQQAESQSSLSR